MPKTARELIDGAIREAHNLSATDEIRSVEVWLGPGFIVDDVLCERIQSVLDALSALTADLEAAQRERNRFRAELDDIYDHAREAKWTA